MLYNTKLRTFNGPRNRWFRLNLEVSQNAEAKKKTEDGMRRTLYSARARIYMEFSACDDDRCDNSKKNGIRDAQSLQRTKMEGQRKRGKKKWNEILPLANEQKGLIDNEKKKYGINQYSWSARDLSAPKTGNYVGTVAVEACLPVESKRETFRREWEAKTVQWTCTT